MTKAESLRREISLAWTEFDRNRTRANAMRVNALRRSLLRLNTARRLAKARREFMFDMNGHHGAA